MEDCKRWDLGREVTESRIRGKSTTDIIQKIEGYEGEMRFLSMVLKRSSSKTFMMGSYFEGMLQRTEYTVMENGVAMDGIFKKGCAQMVF